MEEHYLPEDVLCKIFSYLDDIDHLKSTSLVCKLFCSVSSPLIHKLTLKNSSLTYSDFQRLFKRFPGVNNIHIKFPKLDNALSAISNSGLNLQKLKLIPRYSIQHPEWHTIKNMSISRVITSIKYLRMDRFYGCSKQHVIEFAKLFPSLTEFDFTNILLWNDERVHELTSKLPNLRKIDLSYSNSKVVTDKTLAILSSNCPKLEIVNFLYCQFTPEALYKFFCNNPQLSSIVMPDFDSPSISIVSKVVEGMRVLKNLNNFSLKYNDIAQDAFLTGLAESRPLLKHLLIYPDRKKYTMAGLSRLLFACPGLESLVIKLPYSENYNTYDAELSIVVKGLPYLKHIELTSPVVCQATLCTLVNNCPLLEKIRLFRPYYSELSGVTQVYCDHGAMATPSKKNYSIKLIVITSSPNNSDEWLRSTVESYCPNLSKRKYFMD